MTMPFAPPFAFSLMAHRSTLRSWARRSTRSCRGMRLRTDWRASDRAPGAGETPESCVVVQSLRRAMIAVASERTGELVDTCGTGGGTVTTFNVSTIAAFVPAGAGVRIAKHGNRSCTSAREARTCSKRSAFPCECPPRRLAACSPNAGIVFMFAPALHPAMRHVGPVRRELGFPTVMNLVGPLANPAGTTRQVIGVGDPRNFTLVARALAALGTTHALVVHGEPGMDEISPLDAMIVEVRGRQERAWTLDPKTFQLSGGERSDLRGGEPAENASLAIELLSGGGAPAARSAVILNAAAAIYVSGLAQPSTRRSIARARASTNAPVLPLSSVYGLPSRTTANTAGSLPRPRHESRYRSRERHRRHRLVRGLQPNATIALAVQSLTVARHR